MRVLLAMMAFAAAPDPPPRPPTGQPAAAEEPSKAPSSVSEIVVTAPLERPQPAWAKDLNFDVKGRYRRSGAPYLRQRPSNACKPMAGGATSPIGASGVAAGVVCGKSF